MPDMAHRLRMRELAELLHFEGVLLWGVASPKKSKAACVTLVPSGAWVPWGRP